ncbi:MAG: methyl-accepting chemotaxis protein [Gammaproteobacteria bacterium]|nr:methyl-accepting chemotaxis protein [Gammaproteobacteria bacterium]
MKQTQKLETILLNYFLLIAIAAMMIGVEFYFEMSKSGLQQEICANPTVTNEIVNLTPDNESAALSNLRNKIVVMFGVLTIVMAIVMMMFVKNITRPLQRTLDTAELINDGDLSQVIKIETHDEVGQLGIVINELTSNFQEIASSTAGMINAIESRIEALSKTLDDNDTESARQITLIKRELDSLHAFIDSFNLLETDIKE